MLFSEKDNLIRLIGEVDYHSNFDELTGLPNQNYFNNTLKFLCNYSNKTSSKFALMMLDIDGLSNINYSLGYEYGNKLILEVVYKIKELLGNDVFISRLTEINFSIIAYGLFEEEYENIAKKIISLFSHPFLVNNY